MSACGVARAAPQRGGLPPRGPPPFRRRPDRGDPATARAGVVRALRGVLATDHDDGTPHGPDSGLAPSALFPQQESSAERAYDALAAAAPRSIRWAPPGAFLGDLRRELTDDTEAIGELLDGFGPWNADRDGKLAAVEGIITERHPDEKVLVFNEAAAALPDVVHATKSAGSTDSRAVARPDISESGQPATGSQTVADDLAALLVELWRDDRLCVPPEEAGTTETSIICSMGLRLQQTGE